MQKRKENQNAKQQLVERFLEGEGIPTDTWTTELKHVPDMTHSVVEDFFKNANDKRHLTEGYAFSKTKKFETSGKPLRINLLPNCNMFLLEGHTRPAMKQAKGISSGSGIYSCIVVFDKLTGNIIRARDRSCAAGRRGYCKHIAALCYKLVEAKMSSAKELPRALSCTEIKQQWGVPSIKAQQDPEKELMKKKPLQDITFEKHLLVRDQKGGRKRRLPQEVSSTYSSTPAGEPNIDAACVDAFKQDLSKSKNSYLVTNFVHLNHNPTCVPAADKENTPSCSTAGSILKQRSEAWFQERIGKVTSSKAPAVVGLYGRKEFMETWECIKNGKPEPSKNFKNFQRGINFEESAARCFSLNSGVELSECGMFVLPSDDRFAASPDRIFQGETCSEITNLKTNKNIKLNGQCLLEIKTRAEGQTEPLSTVTGAHICQVQLQMKCTETGLAILQSYVPESNKSKYFLIHRNDDFINLFMNLCTSAFNSNLLEFDSMLGIRQFANALAKDCPEIDFVLV